VKFGELLKYQRPNLVISERHDAWLQANDSAVYSAKAIAFAKQQMEALSTPVDRRGKLSASSLGDCPRQQMFTFMGMPQLTRTAQNVQQLQNGVFLHLRWQMAGLTEGWMTEAEVPITNSELRLRGTMDGISYADTLVEIKSISPHGYSSVAKFGVKEEHRFQVGTYLEASGMERASVVYENKANQEYVEYMVEMDEELHASVTERAGEVWGHADSKTLPEPLSKCIDRDGWQYRFCPYRHQCLRLKSWEDAEETRDADRS